MSSFYLFLPACERSPAPTLFLVPIPRTTASWVVCHFSLLLIFRFSLAAILSGVHHIFCIQCSWASFWLWPSYTFHFFSVFPKHILLDFGFVFHKFTPRYHPPTMWGSISLPSCSSIFPSFRLEQYTSSKVPLRRFLWWFSGWESALQCRGHRFHPWSGN